MRQKPCFNDHVAAGRYLRSDFALIGPRGLEKSAHSVTALVSARLISC